MDNIYTRSSQLIGEDAIIKLRNSTVLVVGIGGVGGTCFEALVRSGVKQIIIIDKDVVDVTNLNRQILFTSEDIGKTKVDIAKNRANKINSDCEIIPLNLFIDESNLNILDNFKIDFIVDAIDSIYSKASLVKYAQGRNIPIILSLGMGKRLDPSMLCITTLNKSTGDPLAKKLRYILKQDNVDISTLKCVISKEEVLNNERVPASMMMVPSAAGLILASYVIEHLIK